ncbi:MAG: inositol monophosphatase [Mariniphaga sp.]|nr:inositol monophosphatase [Mariniphaga sp.]
MNKIIITSLREAGKILMDHFGKILDYDIKESQSSIVTKADIAAEKEIMQIIGSNFPDHNTLGEETGFQNKGSEFTWVVDPLDGTSNFAVGLPWFGIIICVLKNYEPLMAGCYLPFYNEIYFADKGKGATLNGKSISVSKESNLKNVLFCYGLDYSEDFSKTDREAKIFGELVKNTRNLRTANCLIDFCYTADGRIGGCINQATKIWDIAGPGLIIKEAGGLFTDTFGKPLDYSINESNYNRNFTVAGGNKILHNQIIELIKKIN